jgi:hypothetical protein
MVITATGSISDNPITTAVYSVIQDVITDSIPAKPTHQVLQLIQTLLFDPL